MTIEAAFIKAPTLTTNRLQLRPIRPTDAEAFFAIKSNVEVTRGYGQEPHESIEETREWFSELQMYYAMHKALFWVFTLKDEERVIGSCTLWNFSPDYRCAEIGYELHQKFWRQGVMTEAAEAILDYGFGGAGFASG